MALQSTKRRLKDDIKDCFDSNRKAGLCYLVTYSATFLLTKADLFFCDANKKCFVSVYYLIGVNTVYSHHSIMTCAYENIYIICRKTNKRLLL